MTWFGDVFGFEESSENIDRHITIDGGHMHSGGNGRTFRSGTLSVPTLDELRDEADAVADQVPGSLRIREVVADAQALHIDPANAGALFQVASQCNLLEMASPDATPADGITIYEYDHTQGPACAIACAAGTLQRNWFAQSTEDQVDTLAAVGKDLGNRSDHNGYGHFWEMRNGYALLTGAVPDDVPEAHDELAIGIHADTEVTLAGAGHTVTQAYCSALPLGYSSVDTDQVAPLARMVLNSSYEATLAAGAINAARSGNNTVWLTLVGGGVFHNPITWIVDAIERACNLYADIDLDIAIVSYRNSNPALSRLLG
jgi:hypothetical protein